MSYAPPDVTDAAMITNARSSNRSADYSQSHATYTAADADTSGTGDRMDNMRTRKITMTFNGSLQELHDSINAPAVADRKAHWQVPSPAHAAALFGITGFQDRASEKRQANLNQVRFHECRVVARHSTFAVPLALDVTGMKGEYYTATGKRSTLHLFPGSSTVSEVVMRKSPLLQSTFAEEYPGYTADNLRTLGISSMPVGNTKIVVDSHPAIGMMRMNPDILQMADSLDATHMVNGCHQITDATIDRVLNVLEKEVVGRMPDVRCGAFGADLSRIETDFYGVSVPLNSTTGIDCGVANEKGTAAVTFEITFELPQPRVE
jgi:hypothetical protein